MTGSDVIEPLNRPKTLHTRPICTNSVSIQLTFVSEIHRCYVLVGEPNSVTVSDVVDP